MSHEQTLDKLFPPSDRFARRHLGPRAGDLVTMLGSLGADSMDALIQQVVPDGLRSKDDLKLPAALSESRVLSELRGLADQNQVFRSYLGMGYHGTITPPVILRNIFENPGWYTQYTPYQAEISQGRLEALLNFQTIVSDLTGMEVASASLLDEATAAAEAMTLCQRVLGRKADGRNRFFVSSDCHPQTIAVIRTRAEPLNIQIEVGKAGELEVDEQLIGALMQYPDSKGEACDFSAFFTELHAAGALAVVATDLLALTMLRAPGEFGADVVVGNSQRFGVPLGYGGPHAAFMAARAAYQRQLPGRIIGVTRDVHGGRALRMALQTREQHIRREKATSNICTAQVLLAVAASFYAVYHGPGGLRQIAERVRGLTGILALALEELGCTVYTKNYFDSLRILPLKDVEKVIAAAEGMGINLRNYGDGTIGVALDETVDAKDLADIFTAFGGDPQSLNLRVLAERIPQLPENLQRDTDFMSHPVFHSYHSETELLRYIYRLQSKDLSLTTAMIPLGSCTMKLNATSEMIPITWPGFNALHPFAPASQAQGYHILHERLEKWLAEITGFSATSLQPNAGSQGEYSGLLVIRAYHRAHGQEQRDVCLIPSSAHGTNPASAKMVGMRVVVVACDEQGNIDMDDLRKKIADHGEKLAALMVTYPSTHGVFEATIREICDLIHEGGGQVYLDGANMNALVGLCKPGEFGADVCHLNLHKTFCIPHGGGGPGMGPICAAEHLAPFLPGHPMAREQREQAVGAVSAAPFGSPSILPISYAYIAMMGPDGLQRATEVAILNANYIAGRLQDHYPVLYTGANGLVAHECILDLRPLKKTCGIEAADVAKRLMDYGFHAPTLSFPVAGTLMVEPTESESQEELDRFCDAMIQIRAEAEAIAEGKVDRDNNLLKNAPHSAAILAGSWDRPYSREEAAFPSEATREYKFWPAVSRVDDVYGDRNLMCTCPPIADYEDD